MRLEYQPIQNCTIASNITMAVGGLIRFILEYPCILRAGVNHLLPANQGRIFAPITTGFVETTMLQQHTG